MGVSSLPKTVTQQHCGCDLNPDSSAPESRAQTTRLPSHPSRCCEEAPLSKSFVDNAIGLPWRNFLSPEFGTNKVPEGSRGMDAV